MGGMCSCWVPEISPGQTYPHRAMPPGHGAGHRMVVPPLFPLGSARR